METCIVSNLFQQEDKKHKKRKLKLDMHDTQIFYDSSDVSVFKYKVSCSKISFDTYLWSMV